MEHGYLVLDADYRGSPATAATGARRSTGTWADAIWRTRSTRRAGWSASTASTRERIGMYGGSYGGFMTLMAMFTAPSAFRAGAALRPVTDWAHYNHGYTSDILNTPQTRRGGLSHQLADLLRGRAARARCSSATAWSTRTSTSRTPSASSQKLIEIHAQNWDVAFYPVEDHGFVEPSSWSDEYKRIYRLFERELKK